MDRAGYAEAAGGAAGLAGYGEALWWTAMIMTTLGSEYWPKTAVGRVLAFLLALYTFAIFGYSTAIIASFFVGRDQAAVQAQAPAEATATEPAALSAELAALRVQLGSPRAHPEISSTAPLPRESVRKTGSSQLAL